MAEKWIQKAIKKPGALRAELGVKGDKPIPCQEAGSGCEETRQTWPARSFG